MELKNQTRHFLAGEAAFTLNVLAFSAHLLMRGFNFFKTLGACTLSLIMLLSGASLARAAAARVRHHSRAARTASRAQGRRARARISRGSAQKTAIRQSRGASSGRTGGHGVRRRRRPVLEPKRSSPGAEIAQLPLEQFRRLPPLRGSHESLVRQNERADQEGLTRIEDDDALTSLEKNKEIVSIPVNAGLHVDQRLAENRRYCRPWTARFLADLSRVHYARFHTALQVNSAVRTVSYQKHLLLVNGNAAPAEGQVASPHLTGAAVDIGKKGLSLSEIGWLRAYLLPLQSAGKLDVEEEFQQACFHISVYKVYTPPMGSQPQLPPSPRPPRHHTGTLLAARLH